MLGVICSFVSSAGKVSSAVASGTSFSRRGTFFNDCIHNDIGPDGFPLCEMRKIQSFQPFALWLCEPGVLFFSCDNIEGSVGEGSARVDNRGARGKECCYVNSDLTNILMQICAIAGVSENGNDEEDNIRSDLGVMLSYELATFF